MPLRDLAFVAESSTDRRLRTALARALRAVGRTLDELAAHLSSSRSAAAADPVVEFHAESGAPEGALYIDGELVGHVLGVTRL